MSPKSICVLLIVSCFTSMTRAESLREDRDPKPYVEALESLQKARKELFSKASKLMEADQKLRLEITEDEKRSAQQAFIAASTPPVRVTSNTYVPNSKSNSSRSKDSKSKSSDRSNRNDRDAVTVVSAVNQTNVIQMANLQSSFWKYQSMMKQSGLQQNNSEFHRLMTEMQLNQISLCNLADIYGQLSQSESQAAIEAVEKWLEDDPTNIGAMLVRAAALRNLGEIEFAKQIATNVEKLPTPACPLAATLVAQCLYLEGNTEAAIDHLTEAIRVAKGSKIENPLVVRAFLHAASGAMPKALADIRKACNVDKSQPYSKAVSALLEIESNKSKSVPAKLHMEDAMRTAFDKWWQLHEIQSIILAKTGDFAGAEESITRAIDQTYGPRNARLQTTLASYKQKAAPNLDWQAFLASQWSAFKM